MRARLRLARLVFLATLAGLLGGCFHGPAITDRSRTGPFFDPVNHAGDQILPPSIRRVLLLPVAAGVIAEPESAELIDGLLRTALQQQARFEIIILSRAECRRRFGAVEFNSASALPQGMLERLRDAYACDAVMFVDLTAYHPYQPQVIGFRAKLATMDEVRLLWTFDEIFSADNPRVVNSLRRYYYRDDPQVQPPVDLSPSTLLSPSRFAAYAADAMFRTLPLR